MLNKLIKTVVILTILSLFMVWSCDEFQPKEYAISDFDDVACMALKDTTTKIINTFNLVDFDTTWVDSAVNNYVSPILDSLAKKGSTITESDSSFTIITPNSLQPRYVHLFTTHQKVVLFFNEFLEINIIDKNGVVIPMASNALPPATVAECVKDDCENPVDYFEECLIIKSRFEYNLTENNHLLKIMKVDRPERKNTFKVIILSAE